MSSPTSDPASKRPRPGFEPWRKTMLAGALLPLGTSLLGVVFDGLPEAVRFAAYGLGYVLLAIGFAQRMRNRGIRRH